MIQQSTSTAVLKNVSWVIVIPFILDAHLTEYQVRITHFVFTYHTYLVCTKSVSHAFDVVVFVGLVVGVCIGV